MPPEENRTPSGPTRCFRRSTVAAMSSLLSGTNSALTRSTPWLQGCMHQAPAAARQPCRQPRCGRLTCLCSIWASQARLTSVTEPASGRQHDCLWSAASQSRSSQCRLGGMRGPLVAMDCTPLGAGEALTRQQLVPHGHEGCSHARQGCRWGDIRPPAAHLPSPEQAAKSLAWPGARSIECSAPGAARCA